MGTDMWLKKMWYEFWRKNQLEQMKNERDDLAARIQTTEKLIQSIRETIKNLKDAKQWTHDAAQRAKAFENSIEKLSTQLQLAKQDHTAQRAELQAQKASAKENSDRLDEAHKAEMAELAEDIKKQSDELARLETGSHDLHSELEKTKEALKAEIDKLEKSIKELQAKIIATDLQIKEAEMERAQAEENAEAKLATLHEKRTALKDRVASEQSSLDAAKADLERTIREKQVEIEDLKAQLRSDIASLETRISASQKRILEQKRVNEEVMLSSQDKFRANIAEKSRQIEDLTAAKKDSLQELDELRKAHGEAATDAVVSETLHKAKLDLDYKLKLEKQVRETAVDNIRRMEAEVKLKQAELKSKSKWYNYLWHRWITKRAQELERDLRFLGIEIAEQKRAKSDCEELISRLSTQIESKLNAAQLAEVEEVAIEELERQIIDTQSQKKKEMEANEQALRLQKETADEAIKALQEQTGDLKSKKQAVSGELDELENKSLSKDTELAIAKKEKEEIVESHNKTVEGLLAVLEDNEHD